MKNAKSLPRFLTALIACLMLAFGNLAFAGEAPKPDKNKSEKSQTVSPASAQAPAAGKVETSVKDLLTGADVKVMWSEIKWVSLEHITGIPAKLVKQDFTVRVGGGEKPHAFDMNILAHTADQSPELLVKNYPGYKVADPNVAKAITSMNGEMLGSYSSAAMSRLKSKVVFTFLQKLPDPKTAAAPAEPKPLPTARSGQ